LYREFWGIHYLLCHTESIDSIWFTFLIDLSGGFHFSCLASPPIVIPNSSSLYYYVASISPLTDQKQTMSHTRSQGPQEHRFCSHCQKNRPGADFYGINRNKGPANTTIEFLKTCVSCRVKGQKGKPVAMAKIEPLGFTPMNEVFLLDLVSRKELTGCIDEEKPSEKDRPRHRHRA